MAEKQTREILFNDSMTLDKRNQEFAYLRENCLPAFTPGFYPSAGFSATSWSVPALYAVRFLDTDTTTESGTVREGITILEDTVNAIVRIYETANGNLLSEIPGAIFRAAARDDAGYVHIAVTVAGVEKLYIQFGTSFLDDEGAFTDQQLSPYLCRFDGLNFYWTSSSTGSDIHRSEPQKEQVTKVFDDIGFRPIEIDFYGDQMVFFGQDSSRSKIYTTLWDKTDSSLFDKRIIDHNARFIAGGVVDGRLMMVKAIGNSTNLKEHGGRLVISVYDGDKFTEINSIRLSGERIARAGFRQHQSIGNGVMVFGVKFNEDDQNPDLYKNYVYKVYGDGRIETLWQSDGNVGFVTHVGFDQVAIVESNIDFTSAYVNLTQNILTNKDNTNDFADYENYAGSTYITNFLNNAYNLHSLNGMQISFEKLFEQTDEAADPATGEALEIWYRVSERDDFTLIDTITAKKVAEQVNTRRDTTAEYASDSQGLPQQKFDIVKMADGESALPEFNEIQFKFVSLRGFSLIQAIYSYSYLSRTQLN